MEHNLACVYLLADDVLQIKMFFRSWRVAAKINLRDTRFFRSPVPPANKDEIKWAHHMRVVKIMRIKYM